MLFVQALVVLLLLFRILLSVSLSLNCREPAFLKPRPRTRAHVAWLDTACRIGHPWAASRP